MIYNLGHAVFEFIESRWGKEGLRQFLFSLRKSVIGGGEDAYEEALRLKPEEFDQQFEKYLKDRFKPFRDKERPADYGRNLAPNPQKTRVRQRATPLEPSPSGDLMAAMAGNRREQELDIVLLSTKDGSVIRNLTQGLRPGTAASSTSPPPAAGGTPCRGCRGRRSAIGWPTSSRTEKQKSLILQNVVSDDIKQRFAMKTSTSPSRRRPPERAAGRVLGPAQRHRRHLHC